MKLLQCVFQSICIPILDFLLLICLSLKTDGIFSLHYEFQTFINLLDQTRLSLKICYVINNRIQFTFRLLRCFKIQYHILEYHVICIKNVGHAWYWLSIVDISIRKINNFDKLIKPINKKLVIEIDFKITKEVASAVYTLVTTKTTQIALKTR